VLADVFFGSVISLVLCLLLFDQSNMHEDTGNEDKAPLSRCVGTLIGMAVGPVLVVALYYGGFWVLGLVIHDVLIRALILSILMAMLVSTQNSASAISGQFWNCITGGYISVCVLQALGFWPAVLCVLVQIIVSVPLSIIKRFDD
jgi:hypothetical protein